MTVELLNDNALKCYQHWETPDVIISDGAYGVGGFEGDPYSPQELSSWYQPHVQAWTKYSKPSTSLWFWNTEIGWANVHPLLEANGWEYVESIVWDKGLSHIAGNVNSRTIRQFPIATEVSVLYRKRLIFPGDDGSSQTVKQWLRSEWQRSGLPLNRANEACCTKNAATRKYLTQDYLWYWPSGEAVERMARYTKKYGRESDVPYFSLDGKTAVTAQMWDDLRATWNHEHGYTNVWRKGQLSGSERIRKTGVGEGALTAAHLNQKPLEFMELQIASTTNPGDVVWEPFGGLGSAAVASVLLNRSVFYSEVNLNYYSIARKRCEDALGSVSLKEVG